MSPVRSLPRLAASVDELQAPIDFVVARGELSVELPAGGGAGSPSAVGLGG